MAARSAARGQLSVLDPADDRLGADVSHLGRFIYVIYRALQEITERNGRDKCAVLYFGCQRDARR